MNESQVRKAEAEETVGRLLMDCIIRSVSGGTIPAFMKQHLTGEEKKILVESCTLEPTKEPKEDDKQ